MWQPFCEVPLLVKADREGSKGSSRNLSATRLPKVSKCVHSDTKIYDGHRGRQTDCDVEDEHDIEDNEVVAR